MWRRSPVSGDWALDPAWDTLTGVIPAPPEGQHELRVYRAGTLVATAPIASWNVPRVVGVVTDPLGVVAGNVDQVSAASGRFADATDGQLWLFILDTTGELPAADYADRLWAVNEDHMWPGDALALIATSDVDLAVRVGSDLGFYVTPDEVDGIIEAGRQPVIEGRYADAYDVIADGLVDAYEAPPPEPGATPTPLPSPTPETVETPDLVGLSRTDAQAAAEEAGLRVRVVFQQTDQAPAGTVIAQDPPAGRPVEVSGRVIITVALAPALVTVPDVVDQGEEDAVNTLLDAGLELGVRTSRTSANIARGRIISTNPRAGVVVQPGSSVDYVVSRGPAASPTPTPRPSATPGIVTVPDLRGLPEPDALTELGSVGLRAGERVGAFSGSVEEGAIIRTDPAAGVRVERGTAVDYVVSRGRRPSPTPTAVPTVIVPDVRGLTESEAITELTSAGLEAGERARVFNGTVQSGRVIRTAPAAGSEVARGTTVDYVLSRGPRPAPTPAVTPTPRPTPTRTPRPTPTPRTTPVPTPRPPAPTPAPAGDLLQRIEDSGRIVINIDPADAPWTREADDGTFHGFEVDIATRLAQSLGVEAEFTTYPFEQVVTGNWGGRFDIAMQHLAITDSRRSVLDFSQPYAFDPAQLVTGGGPGLGGPGLTSVDDLQGSTVCAARGSVADLWLSGTLQFTSPPVPVAPVPNDLTITGTPTDADCITAVVEGDVIAGLVSADDAAGEIADGAPIVTLGDPVYYAPIGIAYDRAGPDPLALEAQLSSALDTLLADGTIAARSEARFDGLDLTQVPGGIPVPVPPPGGPPVFTSEPALVDAFPPEIDGVALSPLFLNGADLDLLLRPSNPDVSRVYGSLTQLGEGTDLGIAALGLGMAPVVVGDASAMLTGTKVAGMASADLASGTHPALHEPGARPADRTGDAGWQERDAHQLRALRAGRPGGVRVPPLGHRLVRGRVGASRRRHRPRAALRPVGHARAEPARRRRPGAVPGLRHVSGWCASGTRRTRVSLWSGGKRVSLGDTNVGSVMPRSVSAAASSAVRAMRDERRPRASRSRRPAGPSPRSPRPRRAGRQQLSMTMSATSARRLPDECVRRVEGQVLHGGHGDDRAHRAPRA